MRCAISGDAPLPQVTEAMAQASIRGARGNSGLMLSQFLLGLKEGLGTLAQATSADLARAIRAGFDRINGALDEPVEGTILTVAREAADEAERAATERDVGVFVRRLVARTEVALARTPELLETLRAGRRGGRRRQGVRALPGWCQAADRRRHARAGRGGPPRSAGRRGAQPRWRPKTTIGSARR